MAITLKTKTGFGVSGDLTVASEDHAFSAAVSTTADIVDATQDIGTSSEQITLGEIANGGAEMVEIKNLDTTNFVSIGFENPVVAGTKTLKIKAGQSALLPTPSGALFAIADTATVKILKKAVEA